MMLKTFFKLCSASLLITAFSVYAENQEGSKTLADKTMEAAFKWNEQGFRVGQAEQCMNWTRTVLVAACGDKFSTLQSKNPWDFHLLGADETVEPLHADSLASEEFGVRIHRIEDTKAGDLIFLKNTYGNWKDGVITHVGIATGEGKYIHRMTSNKGIVKVQDIPREDFSGAIRLNESLCD